MRKVILSLLVLTILISFACSKKDLAARYDSVSATIGTTAFTTVKIDKSYADASNPTQLTLSAGDNINEYIVLSIRSYNKTSPLGTYVVGTGISDNLAAYHKPGTSSDEIGISGQIIVSTTGSKGDYITGSFDFTTSAGTHISNGTFVAILP